MTQPAYLDVVNSKCLYFISLKAFVGGTQETRDLYIPVTYRFACHYIKMNEAV